MAWGFSVRTTPLAHRSRSLDGAGPTIRHNFSSLAPHTLDAANAKKQQ